MKKLLTLVLASLPFVMYAQMPGMQMPTMQDLPEATIVAHTDATVAELGLNADQAAQLLDLNKKYLGKLQYPVVLPPEAEEAMKNMSNGGGFGGGAGAGAGFNPGNMSQEDRDKMMAAMSDMQDMMAQIEDNQAAYEEGLKTILDKKQLKKWKKAKKHYQAEQRIRMEQQFGGMGGFGGGMPGGGFPGGGGMGGFGGGMPGGGFPGGGGFGF